MTSGKNAASDMPRNQRKANMPLKLKAADERMVKEPNENIRIGSTRAGLNFFPSIEKGGAKITNGTKKIDKRRLYSFGLKFRSNYAINFECLPLGLRSYIPLLIPSVSAFPRFPLSSALNRSVASQFPRMADDIR